MIKTNIEMERESEYRSKRREYYKRLQEYQNLSSIERAFSRKPVEPTKPQPIKAGENFAIQYGQLCVPVHVEEVMCTHGSDVHTITTLGSLGIGEKYDKMWTIVEYQADGTFKDLLTGLTFSKGFVAKDVYAPFYERDGYDTVNFEQLMSMPFGISGKSTQFGDYVVIDLAEITTDIAKSFKEETVPAMEEIIRAIEGKREEHTDLIKRWFDSYISAHEDIENFIWYNYRKKFDFHLDYIESLKRQREEYFSRKILS